MGFFSGRVTFERFTIASGTVPVSFDESHVETLERFAAGRSIEQIADGAALGFTGGNHILDLEFKPEKNIVHGCLAFSVRMDTNKVPADLMRAYTQMELQVLAAENPSGYPTRQQRQQAKELAKERCRSEGESGRFRKMREVPILWDAMGGYVYVGTMSSSAHDLIRPLFRQAFGLNLSQVTSGSKAAEIARELDCMRALDDLTAKTFAGPKKKIDYVWVPEHSGASDFLGNEFFLWLAWILETHSDTMTLEDDSTLTCFLCKTLTLECPLGETGKDTMASQAPWRLPEAKKALAAGKMPRKTGMIFVRHDEQIELVLMAETLGVSSALLPKIEAESFQARIEDRVNQVRHLSESLDLLFGEFCRQRLSSGWSEQAEAIRSWLSDAKAQRGESAAPDLHLVGPEPELRRVAPVEEVEEIEESVPALKTVAPDGYVDRAAGEGEA